MSRNVLFTLLAVTVFAMGLATITGSNDVAADMTVQQSELKLNRPSAAPPVAEAQPTNSPRDQSEFRGTARSTAGETDKKPLGPGQLISSAGWSKFSSYGFSICYPDGFVVQSQDVSKLAHFTPMPVASIFFMNPTMAGGDLAGIEPPDLEVRIYRAKAVDSLKRWLVSVGFVDNGTVIQPYQNAGVNGLKVFRSTMIAPGSSVYFLHRDRVYQLAAISGEGEAMIGTFAFLP